jgi:hypothetical protein
MPSLMPEQESQGQSGQSELASFGEELRREREIRGISLKEIADATKISKRFLEAIERNDHLTLPAPVFTRGFVREYARYVGLSSEEMVNRYNFAVAADDRIEKPPTIEKYPQTPVRDISPKPAPKRGIPSPFARINRNLFAVLFIMAALAAVAWWAVQQRQAEPDPIDIPPAPVTASATPPPLPVPSPVTDDSTLRIAIETTSGSWVTLEADGKTVLNAEMAAGERRNFEASEIFRFRTIGNAAGIRLTLNGMTVPALGGEGEVIRNRVFDLETVQQMRAASPTRDTALLQP